MSKADPAYLESFEAQRKGIYDEYAKASSQTAQWLEATVDLYDFEAANHKTIKLNGNELVFSDPTIKATFDDKMKHSTDLLEKILATEKAQEEQQRKALPDVSLSKLGLRGN
jgi:hypothetical protein